MLSRHCRQEGGREAQTATEYYMIREELWNRTAQASAVTCITSRAPQISLKALWDTRGNAQTAPIAITTLQHPATERLGVTTPMRRCECRSQSDVVNVEASLY